MENDKKNHKHIECFLSLNKNVITSVCAIIAVSTHDSATKVLILLSAVQRFAFLRPFNRAAILIEHINFDLCIHSTELIARSTHYLKLMATALI